MQTSSRRHPCPCCGRTKDSDCRWTDDVILCHRGASHAPPTHLKRGDTHFIDGSPWAVVRLNGGFDGAAMVLRPRRGKQPRRRHLPRVSKKESLVEHLAIRRAIEAWLGEVDDALAVPSFEHSLPHELRRDFDVIEAAFQHGKALKRVLRRAQGRDPSVSATVRPLSQILRDARRDIAHQRSDMRDFRTNFLGEELEADE